MFTVDVASAAAIRRAFTESGELGAVAELRRRYPGLADSEELRQFARIIAGWGPLSAPEAPA